MGGKKRNGEIEILRFVFSVIVVCHHINNVLDIPMPAHFVFFYNGRIAVEFFFLVSGYLMAASAKRRYEAGNIVCETGRFMRKKLMAILPYHVICCTAGLLLMLLFTPGLNRHSIRAVLGTVLATLPDFFFLQHTGIYQKIILTPEWYICAMLWMMLILYPLILRYREKFTRFFCPVLCVLLIGYMIHANGKIAGINRYLVLNAVPKIYVRGFAEMCGGVFAYEIVQALRRIKLSVPVRIVLTAAEAVCFLLPIWFTFSDWGQAYEAYAFYFLFGGVVLAFSEVSVMAGWFNNKAVYSLGRMSLPIYYTHWLPIILLKVPAVAAMPLKWLIPATLAVTFVLSLLIEPAAKLLMKPVNRKIAALHA